MKYTTIFKLFVVVILLIVIGFAVSKLSDLKLDLPSHDFGYSTTLELPTVIEIDTLLVYYAIHDTIFAEADTIYVNTDNDTISAYTYFPNLEFLSGSIFIEHNYTTHNFMISNNMVVHQEVVTKIVNVPYVVPPKLFRLSISGGYYKGVDSGAIRLGCGVTLMDRLSVHLSALSNEMLGADVFYSF